ncbi:hypothetical protein GCM10022281_12090 [Sphingomonas rosea]|uniref:Uncharacterized protein n=1 Tax=Sphingomonas rosea TaxID=335605 RepID=A0ABP7TZS6_9SPHN
MADVVTLGKCLGRAPQIRQVTAAVLGDPEGKRWRAQAPTKRDRQYPQVRLHNRGIRTIEPLRGAIGCYRLTTVIHLAER